MEKNEKSPLQPIIMEEREMDLRAVVEQFCVEGKVQTIAEYGNGHINATYLVQTTEKKYIFQKINTGIFKDVDSLMENIQGVTGYLTEQIKERGGNPDRETLQVIPTREGQSYYRDDEGNSYRVYLFITEATSFDAVEKPEDFYASAVAFGNFQSLLAQYPAHTLHETIPDFHNTPKRFQAFLQAVKEDVCHRAASVQEEINFVLDHEKDMSVLTDMLEKGELPLRVTHNDTKLNNVMIDDATGKGICVIDLDTVMPGLSVNDFGDSIRFGANTAVEDETDLSKVSLSLELYELYAKGFLEGCKGSLTDNELRMLPMGAKTMTLECGMRFLTDYLSGDTYFRIHREHHNLDRCRTQFALVADMEKKWAQMEAVSRKG